MTNTQLLPPIRRPMEQFPNGYAANIHETGLFLRWCQIFKSKNTDGTFSRKQGSEKTFVNFVNEMMPFHIKFMISDRLDNGTYRLSLIDTNNQNEVRHSITGNMRELMLKLIDHYASNRDNYFRERYNTIRIKARLDRVLEKGLEPPPEPVIKEIEVEKIVEVPIEVEKIVEIPGKTVDFTFKAMNDAYGLVVDSIHGNKKLPNKYRYTRELDIKVGFQDLIHVNFILGPKLEDEKTETK